MHPSLMKFIGTTYSRIPPGLRPFCKRAFLWTSLRAEGLAGRRRVRQGRRVQFLDFEIAYLEPYEFLTPGAGEVLVQAEASCVSPGTERAVLCGLPGARRSFPYTPGYSTAGTVIAAGSGVDVRPGDRVAGRMPHCSHGIMTAASLFAVPREVSAEAASFLELGIITLQGIRKARIRPGDSVAVIGQGLIGQLAARLIRLVGGTPITAVASSRRRAKSAVGPGRADRFVALSDRSETVSDLRADVVIEAVGSASAILLAMEAAREGGTVVLLGSSRDLGRGIDWMQRAQQRGLTIIGAHISALPAQDMTPSHWTYREEGRLFLELLASGRLEVSDLITWRPAPEDCNNVYEVVADGGREHVAIVFDWAHARGNPSRSGPPLDERQL